MPRLRNATSNFAMGELSPLLAGRSDITLYKNGAEKLTNMQPLAQGGVTTRPGLRNVATLPGPIITVIPYVFSATARYLLALSDQRLDAYSADTNTYLHTITGCPWTGAQIPTLNWLHSLDTLLIFSGTGDLVPQRVQRSTSILFARDAMPIEVPPFYRYGDTTITLAVTVVGAVGTTGTFTFSTATITALWVGRQLRRRGKRLRIDTFIGTTSGTYTYLEDSTGHPTAADTDWEEEAWGPERGYPSCGEFIDGRLALAGSPSQPTGFWASKSGAFFNWDVGTATDGDAIVESIFGSQAGPVRHMVAQERLQIFTESDAWRATGSVDKPITPTTIGFRRIGPVGVSRTPPARYDSATMFLDIAGGTLREVFGDESSGRYTMDPISYVGQHLVRHPVSMTVRRPDRDRHETFLAMVLEDGAAVVFHSVRTEKIQAYFEWITDGTFLRIVGCGQDLYAVVERAAGVVRLERFYPDGAPLDGAVAATSGARTRTFGGFAALAGQTVAVVSRGHDLGETTVDAGGVITLSAAQPAVFEIEAGLRFTQTIRPMPVDFDLPDGPARGLQKRLLRCFVQTRASGQFVVQGNRVIFPHQGDDVDTPPTEFNGISEFRLLGVSREAQFDLTVEQAMKLSLLSLTREVSIGG